MLLDYYLFECICDRCVREHAQQQALAGMSTGSRRRAQGAGGAGSAGAAGSSSGGKGKRTLR